MTAPQTFTAMSSNGRLTVSLPLGDIVAIEEYDPAAGDFDGITRLQVPEWVRAGDEVDVLYLGVHTEDGRYDPPVWTIEYA